MGEKINGAVLMVETGGTMRRSKEGVVVPIMDMVTTKEELASAAEPVASAEETSVVAVATTRMAVEATVDMEDSEAVVEEWAVDPEGVGEVSGGRV